MARNRTLPVPSRSGVVGLIIALPGHAGQGLTRHPVYPPRRSMYGSQCRGAIPANCFIALSFSRVSAKTCFERSSVHRQSVWDKIRLLLMETLQKLQICLRGSGSKYPKSNKSRKVDMAASLAEILKAHQTAMKRETLARVWGKVPSLVFVTPKGKPLSPKTSANMSGIPRWKRHPYLAGASMKCATPTTLR